MIPNQPNDEHLNNPSFQSLLVECLEKLERGESLDTDRLLEAYPEHADSLAAFLTDQEMLKRVASEIRDSPSAESRRQSDALIEETIDSNPKSNDFAAGDRIRYIGEYEILDEIARGGMGIVFKARQQKLQRVVALKMILSGQFADAGDVKRFHREARAAGRLKHPNIVPVHEIGEHDGHHYFTMDYIDGHSLSDEIRDESLPPRRAAEIVRITAEAVHFAHEQGTVHRDLKPANVMLTADGSPHITDFGLAKMLKSVDEDSRAELTASGQILGTPSYMSPEQASGKQELVGPASDIYSLGSILYASLTGRAPFVADSPVDTLLQVMKKEPVSPRELNPSVPKDLNTICLKCLNKEPHRRYGTAQLLADDLERFRDGRPVLARPISRTARAWRWCKRNPVVTALLILVIVALLGGTITSTSLALIAKGQARLASEQRDVAMSEKTRADEQTLRATTQLTRSQWLTYALQLGAAQREWETNSVTAAWQSLDACRSEFRNWEHDYLRTWFTEHQRTLRGHEQLVTSVCYNAEGTRIASGSWDGSVRIWNAEDAHLLRTLEGHESWVNSIDFSADGARLVSASLDKTVKLWDVTTGKEIRTLSGHEGSVYCVRFDASGERIATGSWSDSIKIWSIEGELLQELTGHQRGTHAVAFDPDGASLASGGNDATVRLWDLTSGEQSAAFSGHEGFVTSVTFTPDGKRIISGSSDQTAKVWSVETGRELFSLHDHQGTVSCVAVAADGSRIATVDGSATTDGDGTVKIWDARDGEQLFVLRGHLEDVLSADFGPDGQKLVSGSEDQTLKIWDVTRPPGPLVLDSHSFYVTSVAFSPDGRQLASGSQDKSLKIWDAITGELLHTLKTPKWRTVTSVAYSPDGKWIASGEDGFKDESYLYIWDAESGELRTSFACETDGIVCLAFSPDGSRIACGNDVYVVEVRDAESGEVVCSFDGHSRQLSSVAFNPEGTIVASAAFDRTARLWRADSGEELRTLSGHESAVWCARFSPDGERIVTVGGDNRGIVWEVATGQQLVALEGHTGIVSAVAYSPDGERIVTGSRAPDKTLKVWNALNGQSLLTLKGHARNVTSVAFSPDGKRVASCGEDNLIVIWNADSSDSRVLPRNGPR